MFLFKKRNRKINLFFWGFPFLEYKVTQKIIYFKLKKNEFNIIKNIMMELIKKLERKYIILKYDKKYKKNEMEITVCIYWFIKINVVGNNFISPINSYLKDESRILNYEYGSGSWSYNMAKIYNLSYFYNISIINNKYRLKNIIFIKNKIYEKLPFKDNFFDFIYQRLLILSIKKENWNKIIREYYRILKKGGFIEIMEFDTKVYDANNELTLLNNNTVKILEKKYDTLLVKNILKEIKNARFINIKIKTYKIYLDQKNFLENIINSYILYKLTNKELSIDEYRNYISNIINNIENRNAYFILYIIYAQK